MSSKAWLVTFTTMPSSPRTYGRRCRPRRDVPYTLDSVAILGADDHRDRPCRMDCPASTHTRVKAGIVQGALDDPSPSGWSWRRGGEDVTAVDVEANVARAAEGVPGSRARAK